MARRPRAVRSGLLVLTLLLMLQLTAASNSNSTEEAGALLSDTIAPPTPTSTSAPAIQRVIVAEASPSGPWSLTNILTLSIGCVVLIAILAVVAVRARKKGTRTEKIEAGPYSSTYVGDGSLYILEDLSPCPVISLRPSAAQDLYQPPSLHAKRGPLPTVSPFLSTQRMYNPVSLQGTVSSNAAPAPYVIETPVQNPSLSESIASYLDSPFRFPSECESETTPRESDESLENYDSSFGPNDTSTSFTSVNRYRL
ncbi:hypothetical protein SPRG_13405 [Saprolegnia parasitica CBS 223.65]|uniref:Uncharacterized protein n=1 Tax=Saprolegnia parasitica (strain CBS 223.65) TaxID=695850 RepID=A0A067C1I7_SAPPC|nr:hypothetical protein SPRG_13405 [Saprolegnia parasitica CBS 223.65]KDO20652.1 hypothetical protein SPRG_13405 [Saprolegnia parasitica CBS 223.65]|eukprot:XP_012208618.1 hypothetical protein SPRG_13405 [Saprolegnia parasitica CBS 223.65]